MDAISHQNAPALAQIHDFIYETPIHEIISGIAGIALCFLGSAFAAPFLALSLSSVLTRAAIHCRIHPFPKLQQLIEQNKCAHLQWQAALFITSLVAAPLFQAGALFFASVVGLYRGGWNSIENGRKVLQSVRLSPPSHEEVLHV